jgi:SAM-dependent MidA family methyltransferase
MQRSLEKIIRDKIRSEGPLSFHDFMEMALYYPGLGYYTSEPGKIGKHGDYYTAPHLSAVYGNLVAKQLEEMWQLCGKKDFTVVEYGAGMGSLCNDILDQVKQNKEFFKQLKYCIIEKSEAMRRKQMRIVAPGLVNEKIAWYDSIEDIPSFTGCVLANEVLDNFSVHKVIMKENELKEIFVDYDNGFIEVQKPAHDDLKEYFAALAIELPNDFCAEVNLEAVEWIKRISSSLDKGFVLTIDYGYPSSELYQSYHRLGTIVCYNKHTVNDLPYNNIGLQDITAHVNFSALKFWGAKHGLNNCGFTNQSQFLLGLGLTEHLRKLEEKENNSFEVRKKLMMLHTLLMSMGKKFKVLIQQKGLTNPLLSGLQFCQPLI